MIADALTKSPEFELVGDDVWDLASIETALGVAAHDIDVLIVVGDMGAVALDDLLGRHAGIVISHIVIGSDAVRFNLKSVGVDQLLSTLIALARDRGSGALRAVEYQAVAGMSGRFEDDCGFVPIPARSEVMDLAVEWISAVLRQYNRRFPIADGEVAGLSRANASIELALAADYPADDATLDVAERLFVALDSTGHNDEPLVRIRRRLGLSDTEIKILLLCLAPDLDVRYHRVIGSFNDDMTRRGPTLALACSMLGEPLAVRAALARAGGLARWQLLDCGALLPRGDDVLRVDPSVAQWLLGDPNALLNDAAVRAASRAETWRGADLLTDPLDIAFADSMAAGLASSDQHGRWFVLGGADGDGWRALTELAASRGGPPLLRVSLQALASGLPGEAAGIAARIARAAILLGASPVIDAEIDDAPVDRDAAMATLAGVTRFLPQGTVLITSDARRCIGLLHAQVVAVFERDAPATPATVATYATAAAQFGLALSADSCVRLGHSFPMALGSIEDAVRLAALQGAGDRTPDAQYDAVAAACRHVASPDMPRFAKRIVPTFTLDDVVLPAEWHKQLRELVGNVVHAPRVMNDWGFAANMPSGRGIAALFHGPSGTGKTTAAHAIAHALDTDVYQADLSLLESKFIGETAKNVDAVFTDAERSHAVLVCDEADSILGKRSEIKDAHDRYANIDVAYLLQRIEAYSGLVILTTNFRQNIDQAFLRRFRFVVEFPNPDAEGREQIWSKCLPRMAPVAADVDFGFLARRVEVTGGNIRQITVRAAFSAAADNSSEITMRHVLAATRAELVKVGQMSAVREIDEIEALRHRNLRQVA
ncbi:ATP-binding protein [Mesorhizobium sp. M0590]|uniref:ATP-binding protein n=1 Tax=Mesorhizobium sp. M0590 TaxID=2956966 RepID=UPI0033362FC6